MKTSSGEDKGTAERVKRKLSGEEDIRVDKWKAHQEMLDISLVKK
jgi:hypothetical protein